MLRQELAGAGGGARDERSALGQELAGAGGGTRGGCQRPVAALQLRRWKRLRRACVQQARAGVRRRRKRRPLRGGPQAHGLLSTRRCKLRQEHGVHCGGGGAAAATASLQCRLRQRRLAERRVVLPHDRVACAAAAGRRRRRRCFGGRAARRAPPAVHDARSERDERGDHPACSPTRRLSAGGPRRARHRQALWRLVARSR